MTDRYGLSTISTELHDDGVLVATLNRPEQRNSLNPQMHLELKLLYERIVADEELNAVVLTGAGKYFCVGADFNDMKANEKYPDGHPGLLIESVAMARNILAVRVPLIAAINGDAIGIGATISLFCDVVYMADDARIADPHVRGAIVSGDGGAVLWPLLMGPNRAKEYLMTGDLVSAADADRLGLVNHVVPRDQVFDEATGHGEAPRRGPGGRDPLQQAAREQGARDARRPALRPVGAFEAITFETADHREAVDSFLEKRPATFRSGKPGGT